MRKKSVAGCDSAPKNSENRGGTRENLVHVEVGTRNAILYCVQSETNNEREGGEMKMRIRINHNGFHGRCSATVIVAGAPGEAVELSASQVRRLRNLACGIKSCECGESLLAACEDETSMSGEPRYFLRIPREGDVIHVSGNYPQNN